MLHGKCRVRLNSLSAVRLASTDTKLKGLHAIQEKAVWLSSYMIHHANNLRIKRDGLKVGGHQASSTSSVSILTALYFSVLRKQDRVAVKPHASPIFHSLQYLLGNQTKENLQNFRSFGGAQSYPSRTKDKVDVDFSTGSVGLGAAITTFAAYAQDWLRLKNYPIMHGESGPGRMIALVGDAELDEGNVYECLMESWKLNMNQNWYIIDFNRQSLDKVAADASFRQIDKMFRANGWEIIVVKYGKKMMKAFEGVGGKSLKKWFNSCDNNTYCSLVFRGGSAFRKKITEDAAQWEGMTEFLASVTDAQLEEIMTNLGGHCFETLLEAFDKASSAESQGKRTCFICFTIKGFKLPLQGHRDNHGLFLNQTQIDHIRHAHNIADGCEWDTLAGLSAGDAAAVQELVAEAPLRTGPGKHRDYSTSAAVYDIPDVFYADKAHAATTPISTQAAFGHILLEMARSKEAYADRVMTMAPDVATSTNLGGFLNQRGVFGVEEQHDPAKQLQVMSMNKWHLSPTGQHVELGIAENNLFLMLSAAGMTASLFGQRILPIGTLYDPFIARALDALNYGCYQDSRFMVVATPSGISLSPEGGAHQSINTPLIGMGQPGLAYLEPAFADELQVAMSWGLRHMQKPTGEGGCVYLRLSTRPLLPVQRVMTSQLREDIIKGAYVHGDVRPGPKTKLCIVFVGCVYPEALEACEQLRHKLKSPAAVSLIQVTSPDLLYQDHNDTHSQSHVSGLLKDLPSDAAMVTVLDGHPAALSWLGGVHGHRIHSLGVTNFGQCGDIIDLYKHYGLDTASIVTAASRFI